MHPLHGGCGEWRWLGASEGYQNSLESRGHDLQGKVKGLDLFSVVKRRLRDHLTACSKGSYREGGAKGFFASGKWCKFAKNCDSSFRVYVGEKLVYREVWRRRLPREVELGGFCDSNGQSLSWSDLVLVIAPLWEVGLGISKYLFPPTCSSPP